MKSIGRIVMYTVFVCITVSVFAAGGSEASAPAPVTIEFLSGRPAETPPDDQNYIVQAISEKFGVNFKFSGSADGADVNRQLSVRIAGGNPPEIFRAGSKSVVADWKNDGVLLDFTPYEDRLPNWKTYVGDKTVMDNMRFDGKLYALVAPSTINYGGFYIRKDWLDNLGIQAPATWEEAFAVAKAFTFDDPDRNGKNDTYGMAGIGWGTFKSLFASYGIAGLSIENAGGGSLLAQVDSGKVIFSLYDPRFRAALTEAKRWIDAGVIDPEVMTHKGTDYWNKVYQGRYGMIDGRWPELRKPQFAKMITDVNPDARWALIQPPAGPAGSYFAFFAKGSVSSTVFPVQLPGNSVKLDKTLAIIDWLCTTEGQRLVSFGREGIHYNLENGKVVPTPEMDKLTWTHALQIMGRPDLEYLPVKFSYAEPEVTECMNMPLLPAYEKMVGAIPDTYNKADADRFITESMNAFLYGQRSLDEFDAFLKTLESTYDYNLFKTFITEEFRTLGLTR